MVTCTSLGNGPLPCWHVVCTKVTCDLWLQLTQSLGWPERAPSTNPCALKALDPPLKGGLTTNSSFQCPSGTIRRPSGLCVPTTGTTLGALYTPQQPLTLASISQNQVKGKENLQNSSHHHHPLGIHRSRHVTNHVPHGGASRLNPIHQPHHPTSITHHISWNICNYDGSKCKKADRHI
jgi:hypothetical protein